MNTIILIDSKGRESDRLKAIPRSPGNGPWIYHNGKWWGFGVGKLNGEQYYYEVPEEKKSKKNS